MISSAISSATLGIQQNLQRFTNAASRVADPDQVPGITEILEIKSAARAVQYNASVIRTADEMTGHLIDILA